MNKIPSRNIKILLRKIFYTLFIIFVYILGRHLVLPFSLQDLDNVPSALSFTTALSLVTGGDFTVLSPFTLGLSPWMSTLILWQLFSSFEIFNIKKLSGKASYRLQLFIAITISAIQGAALLYLQFEHITSQLPLWQNCGLLLIIIGGSIFIVWLGNMNGEYGLGGIMILMLVGIILNAVQLVLTLDWTSIIDIHNTGYLLLAAIFIYFYVWQIVAMSQAEYQVPIRRILISQEYKQSTTLPIPLLPSGGMQFMYSMILYNLFTMLIQAISKSLPEINGLNILSKHLGFDSWIGLTLYMLVVAILCFAFGSLNFNTQEVAEGLQKSGDFLVDTMPGNATKKKLDKILFRISIVEILYSCLLSGLPLIYSLFYPQYRTYALSVTMFFILISLSLNIIRQSRFILEYNTTPSIIEYLQQNK